MYTFLEVVNLALREVNEIPMSDQQLANARGLQQFAKESANRAFFDISNESPKWPWLQKAVDTPTQQEVRKLTTGTQWYDTETIAAGLRQEPDWNTFLLTDKDLTSTDPLVIASNPILVKNLQFLTYDEWISKFRTDDFKGNTGEPKYIIKYSSGNYGLTPVPDADYSITYNVRSNATRFTLGPDVVPIPEEFVTVLVSRIKYFLWLFRENDIQAKFSLGEYQAGLLNMKRSLLSNKEERMRAI
jgi:hypothetical protein|tara:strand:+ start:8905 stop:9636 length:732 start_codon:yes stop_codon:yes gene_type:complete